MICRRLAAHLYTNNSKFVKVFHRLRQYQLDNVLCARSLHLTTIQTAKIYVDRENMHAHQVLKNSEKPYQLFGMPSVVTNTVGIQYDDIIKKSPASASSSDMFEHFQAICQYCRQSNTLISNKQFQTFVQQYCDIIHKLTDDQLKDTLWALSLLPPEESIRSTNFVELWTTLDIECCRRIDKWQTDQLLLISDAWYSLNLTRVCEFVWEALRKVGRKVRKMESHHLVQTMFLCNVMRRSIFEMFDFEANLVKCAKEMSIAELGVMSMGFFKTQTPIRNPELIKYIYDRLMDELHTVDDITFVAILKVLRYSSKLPQVDIMMQLLDKIYHEKLETTNLLTALHIALMGCELQTSHDELIEKIIWKFNNEFEDTRLKELERISLVITLFNIRTASKIEETLCAKILESLKGRIDEILKYPKCFTNCLHFLTLHGYYDSDMLSSALEHKFLKHAVGSALPVSRAIFHLDTFTKVNLQGDQYKGPQLSDKTRKTMGKHLTHYIPERNQKFKLNATDNILLQVKDITDMFLPNNRLLHILPNYERSDIVICYDRVQHKSVPIADTCPENYSGVILTRDHLLAETNTKDIDTVAIVIAGWNNVVRDKNRNTGLFDMKLKQLELLGHKPVLIYWHEWRALETHPDRINFIKRRLSKVIHL